MTAVFNEDDSLFAPFLTESSDYRPLEGLHEWAFEQTGDPQVREGLAPFSEHVHRSWSYALPGAVCTPSGRVRRGRHLLRRSSTYWHMSPAPTARDLAGEAVRDLRRGRALRLPVAASLRDPVDTNYWHFHDDLLGRLVALDAQGHGAVPLLISPALAGSPWFTQLRDNTRLRERQWVVQDRTVLADLLLVSIRGSLRPDMPQQVRTLLGEAPADSVPDRSVFLTRGPGRARRLSDQAAVALALPGFDVVDTDELSISEQRQVFATAGTIVAVHGAGLVNLVHRLPRPARLLELFPQDFVHPHFVHMARANGMQWGAVVGTALDSDQQFSVDPEAVRRALQRMG